MGTPLPRFGRLALKAFDFALSELFQTECLGCKKLSATPLCEACHWFPWLPAQPGAPVQSALAYGEPWRTVLHEVKFARNLPLLSLFKDVVGAFDFPSFPKGIAIVPVPIHFTTLRSRGFNQSEWLARWVAGRLGERLFSDFLFKGRATPAQSTLDKASREANLRGCFQPRYSARIPKSVLLVDDVLTTGTTLSSCSDVLTQVGVDRVFFWTLFRV